MLQTNREICLDTSAARDQLQLNILNKRKIKKEKKLEMKKVVYSYY